MRGVLETSVGNTELNIAYTLNGPSGNYNDTTLLYIHGLGCSEQDFAGANREELLARRQVLSFTHPGCDDTPYPEGVSLGTEDLVTVTRDLLVALDIGPVALVGHSFGGLVAIRYADKYPENVAGLVSVEGNLQPQDCFLSRKIASGEEDRDSLIARFAVSQNPGFRKYAMHLSKTDPRALKDYATSAVEHTDREDLLEAFSDLYVPKAFVYGSENVESIDYLEELFERGIDVRVTPNSNHFPDADNPYHYFRLIGEFVANLDYHA